MSSTLRLLQLGTSPRWLPPWRDGRLLFGSAPTADVALGGALLPFHGLVELAGDGAVVHDFARRGDVRDQTGAPVGPAGLRLEAGDRFEVGGAVLALVLDESLASTASLEVEPCLVCREPPPRTGPPGRFLLGVRVCAGCLGTGDLSPDAYLGYELVARLGQGGAGAVYLALRAVGPELVALKALRAAGERAATRFANESRLLGRLAHRNVVRVIDAGTRQGEPFLVCELVRGGDALGLLSRSGPLEPLKVVRLGLDVARALRYLHGEGIVHRDVKPSNVLLEPDGTARLADFGLARDLLSQGLSTGAGTVLGTLAYAAPEQLKDARLVGPAADVFGLGATLFHLTTGKPPRAGLSVGELRRTRFEQVPDARTIAKATPAPLAETLAQLLDADPSRRPIGAALEAAFVGLGGALRSDGR